MERSLSLTTVTVATWTKPAPAQPTTFVGLRLKAGEAAPRGAGQKKDIHKPEGIIAFIGAQMMDDQSLILHL